MKPSRIAVASSLLACILANPTQAAVLEASASVSITDLTFTLIDLDPTDGISPSIRFADWVMWRDNVEIGTQAQASSTDHLGKTHGTGQGIATGKEVYSPSPSILFPVDETSVTAHGGQATVQTNPSSLTIRATTSLDTSGLQPDIERSAQAMLNTSGRFYLSAQTAVVIHGTYAIDTTLLPGPQQANPNKDGNHAKAMLLLAAYLGQTTWLSDGAMIASWDRSSLNESRAGAIDFTLSNADDSESQGALSFDIHTSVGVDSGVTPVPEADTTLLALAGLGMLGWASQRRRRKAD